MIKWNIKDSLTNTKTIFIINKIVDRMIVHVGLLCKMKYPYTFKYRSSQWWNMFPGSGGIMSQAGSQDDGEYEVIIVDENNSSILADHDVTSSGPPSTKVSDQQMSSLPLTYSIRCCCTTLAVLGLKNVLRKRSTHTKDAYVGINWSVVPR